MSIQLAKIWHDLWGNKSRTLQVVMVIALGAIAIGLVVGGNNLISENIREQWNAAGAPFIKLSVTPNLTDDQVAQIGKIEGVAEVEGQFNASVEYRLLGETEWKTAQVQSRVDFSDQKMEKIGLISGDWPERGTLGVIKTADRLYGVGEGQTIEVRFNDQVRRLPITGTLKPVGPFPVVFLGNPVFYADRTTFARLTGRDTFDMVVARDTVFDRAAVEATDLRIQDYFEKLGVDSVGVLFPFQNRVISPEVPPGVELLQAIFLILGIIGVVIIILGVFLVYNSISAILTQQIGQIGVMKAIGARPTQVLFGYGTLVLAYGMLAALVALPLGALGARGLQSLFLNVLNMDDPGFTADPFAASIMLVVSLGVPLLAALFPLLAGVKITVREAISTYGLSSASSLVDKLVSRVRRIPYSIALMIGSAFRNVRRVIFIELTLILAGVIFMMVQGVNDSTRFTFGPKLTGIHNYQITLSTDQPHRESQMINLAKSDPEVSEAESWLVLPASIRPITQDEAQVTDTRIQVFGLPAETRMYRPDLAGGRWLLAGDERAAVLTSRLAEENGWSLGEWIRLSDVQGRESEYQIVGITYDPLLSAAAFVPLPTLQLQTGLQGQGNTLWVQIISSDDAALQATAVRLTETFNQRGLTVQPRSTFREATITQIVNNFQDGFSLIIQLLAIMAVIIAIVGGVGLSGVISLNVLERRREIGVMRSIGASDRQVLWMFIGEGLLLAWISWLVALPLSIPAAKLMSTVGLSASLNQQLTYNFTPVGALVWFLIISLMAVIASALPARGAARISVRESLAY